MTENNQRLFPLRTVVFGALLPAFLFSVGIGAILPVIAPVAVSYGASLATAGLIAAMLPIGQILADLPAGALAARIGDRAAMIWAGSVAAVAFGAALLAPSFAMLGFAILCVGAANAVFHLARHSYLTKITPSLHRARVLSTLGGVHRIGQFVGPFLGALVASTLDTWAIFALAVVTTISATVTVVLAKPADAEQPHSQDNFTPSESRTSLREVIFTYRTVFLRLGSVTLLVGAIRGARQQVIPLWGEYIGLDMATISVIFGLAGAIDMLLFYPAGKIMDKFGRLWIGVPAMCMLGIAMAIIPLAQTSAGLAFIALFLGFANGLGSGIMMTVSSDIAPDVGRPQFLSAWRLLSDLGMGAGPLILSLGAAAGSLAVGVWVSACCGPAAATAMARWLPQYSEHANLRGRR